MPEHICVLDELNMFWNVIKGETVVGGSQKITLLPNYRMDGCMLDVIRPRRDMSLL